ncbi:hypothetical protein [Lysinibacillus xylanilyticus]
MTNIVSARAPAAQAKRQRQCFICAKAKRQRQSAQSERKSAPRYNYEPYL